MEFVKAGDRCCKAFEGMRVFCECFVFTISDSGVGLSVVILEECA